MFILSVCCEAPQTIMDVELYQGFMQEKIIASYTCFGGHMDVNC